MLFISKLFYIFVSQFKFLLIKNKKNEKQKTNQEN